MVTQGNPPPMFAAFALHLRLVMHNFAIILGEHPDLVRLYGSETNFAWRDSDTKGTVYRHMLSAGVLGDSLEVTLNLPRALPPEVRQQFEDWVRAFWPEAHNFAEAHLVLLLPLPEPMRLDS